MTLMHKTVNQVENLPLEMELMLLMLICFIYETRFYCIHTYEIINRYSYKSRKTILFLWRMGYEFQILNRRCHLLRM